MRIAFDIGHSKSNSSIGYLTYINQLVLHVARQQPQHQFLIISTTPLPEAFSGATNVEPLPVKSLLNKPWFKQWWHYVTLPLLLRKHKIDQLVHTGEANLMLSAVPRLVVVSGSENHSSKRRKLSPVLPSIATLQKATAVVAVSQFLQTQVLQTAALSPAKVFVAPPAPLPGLQPLEWEEREAIKEKYAEGCEYFAFTGGFHSRNNLLNLLKAFSLFKKRQQTNMKLLITGDLVPNKQEMLEKIESYKFRKGVIILGMLPRQAYTDVLAGAYALVYPGMHDHIALSVLESMACGVPVICSNTNSLPLLVNDCALLIDPMDAAGIAEHMKRLFKDENLRAALVNKGLERSGSFTWQLAAEALWKAIEHSASK